MLPLAIERVVREYGLRDTNTNRHNRHKTPRHSTLQYAMYAYLEFFVFLLRAALGVG